jgi:hypothetical protein
MAVSNPFQANDDSGRVVRFPPRMHGSRANRPGKALTGNSEPDCSPVPDLAKYHALESDDAYRHRMIVNLVVLLFTSLLILAGVCLAMMVAHA